MTRTASLICGSVGPALCLLACLLSAGCSDSSDPARDNTGPDACVELSITTGLWWDNHGIMVTTFSADPLCTSDDVTNRPDLIARWDYEDDGVWDTDWQPLRYADCFVPDPIPTDLWRVRLAVRDEAGNTRTIVEERPIPDWLPAGPDVAMGNINVAQYTDPGGGGFVVYEAETVVWGWNLPTWEAVACELYVDDVLVLREEVPPVDVANRDCRFDDGECVRDFGADLAQYLTPGSHEIRFVVDADDQVAEVDETNNVTVVTVEAPGP